MTRTHRRRKDKRSRRGELSEPQPSTEAIIVAWVASVTSVLMADLATIAAHFYARFHPASRTAPLFESIMLVSACLLGAASLGLLIAVWRTSRLKPPKGFLGFAVLVALAPVVALAARLLTSVSLG